MGYMVYMINMDIWNIYIYIHPLVMTNIAMVEMENMVEMAHRNRWYHCFN